MQISFSTGEEKSQEVKKELKPLLTALLCLFQLNNSQLMQNLAESPGPLEWAECYILTRTISLHLMRSCLLTFKCQMEASRRREEKKFPLCFSSFVTVLRRE